MDETKRTYRTMADKSIGKCSSGHWLPLKGNCDLCGAGPYEKCKFTAPPESKKVRVPEHCQTCGQTDREYSHTARICSDPWHADDHLRRASAVSNGERNSG